MLRRGKCTVEHFCTAIHKDIIKQFKHGKLTFLLDQTGSANDVQRWCGVRRPSTHEVKKSVWSMFWRTKSMSDLQCMT